MKKLSLTINIPSNYRYMARQPYGDICLFKEKPHVIMNGFAGGQGGEECWAVQDGEISIFGNGNSDLMTLNTIEDWRESLIDFGY